MLILTLNPAPSHPGTASSTLLSMYFVLINYAMYLTLGLVVSSPITRFCTSDRSTHKLKALCVLKPHRLPFGFRVIRNLRSM